MEKVVGRSHSKWEKMREMELWNVWEGVERVEHVGERLCEV